MDVDAETNKFKWMMRFGIGLLFTTFFVVGELKYLVFGTNVDATVTSAKVVNFPTRRGSVNKLVVDYTFVDAAGNTRKGEDQLDPDWTVPSGTVPITYRGTDGPSRLAGHYNYFGIGVWLVFFIPTAIVLGSWIKESMDYAKEKKARAAKEKPRYRY